MTVQTDDLITKADVGDALMRSDEGDVIRDQVLEDGADFEEEALETITSVSDEIRDWLGRDIMLGAKTDYTGFRSWSRKDAHPVDPKAHPYRYYTRYWPVHVVTGKSDTNISVMVTQDKYGLWSTADTLRYVKYIFGYKRPDQDLTAFSQEIQDAMTASDAEDLPEKIRNVAENLVLFRLNRRLSGLIGTSVSEVSYGDFENTKTKREAEQDYEQRQLRTLNAGHAALS